MAHHLADDNLGGKLKNKKALFIVLPIIFVIIIIIGFRITGKDSQNNFAGFSAKPTLVKRGSINSSISATGIVVSANQVNLNFDNSGMLDDLNIALNEKVEDGQDLATLDPSNDTLAKEILESPIDGTVIHIGAKDGEIVTSSGNSGSTATTSGTIDTSGFMTIADLSNLQIKMSIDQADIQKVSKGQKVKIILDAFEDKVFSGKVVSIDPVPANDQNVITYTAYASIAKSKTALRLGMSADVELEYGKKDNVLLVPSDVVRNINGRKVVMVMAGARPQPVEVKVGQSDDENTEIISGLYEGDKIMSGRLNLGQEQPGTGNRPGGGFMFGGGMRSSGQGDSRQGGASGTQGGGSGLGG